MTLRAAGQVGGSAVHLSRICLGTMRLSTAGDASDAARLLVQAHERGVTAFHCSSEYGTYPLFRSAWEQAGLARRATVVAKVAVPHYGEDCFSPAAFRRKIEDYFRDLAIPRLDVVQWLLRYDLDQDEARVRIMRDAAAEIADVVSALKREGKIGAVIGFPYSEAVAEELIAADYCDGLALYLNPLEHEMDHLIAPCGRAGKSVVAIRPYAAGRLFSETDATAQDALAYVFDHPEVVTAVVSASSVKHLDALTAFTAAA